MKTPIFDFVSEYNRAARARMHMPGHKGYGPLGCECRDITEIPGADVLYSAEGIIAQSEDNATALFNTGHTYYSAEGSTLAVKAMLAIAMSRRNPNTPPLLLAGRNAHKALIYAAALLDFDIEWMLGTDHVCKCDITPELLDAALRKCRVMPFAVYVTSPDYLGGVLDILSLSAVCKRYGVPLLVDNAHGAYLAFLEPSHHPIALGADMCADSAHKTLPVLTGGAYLHVSERMGAGSDEVRSAMSLFASTSPSYLILQSLDKCNEYLSGGYRDRLSRLCRSLEELRRRLRAAGYSVLDTEPLKLTLCAADFGYTGTDIATILREGGIECEYADDTYTVLMLTPENNDGELERLESRVVSIPPKPPLGKKKAVLTEAPQRAVSIREAVMSPSVRVPTREAVGRICAEPAVSCPPAVAPVVSGEVISTEGAELLRAYGISDLRVMRDTH